MEESEEYFLRSLLTVCLREHYGKDFTGQMESKN